MGTIRTLLALCVVVFHSYTILGSRFTGGMVAVQCFYIISGFYMALILHEKYSGPNYSYKLFITNRLLRLYPQYAVVLCLSFLISVIGINFWNTPYYLGMYAPHWHKISGGSKSFLIFENIFLVTQDLVFFLRMNFKDWSLIWTQDIYLPQPKLLINNFNFVPQAWTVSVEVYFYLLAPFLVLRKWFWQLAVVILSLGLRFYIYKVKGWTFDPWSYRFFPNELAFFMSGSLLYLFYRKVKNVNTPAFLNGFIWSVVFAAIIFYDKIPIKDEEKCWYFYGIFALSVPFLFHFSKTNKTDRFIGELSYPIYIIHHLVMMLVKPYFWEHPENMKWFGISTVLLTIPVAIIIWYAVSRPIEKLRQKRVILNRI